YDNHEKFNISLMTAEAPEFSEVQLAIDTQEDFDRFEWIINNLECDPADSDIATLVKLAKEYSSNVEKKI
ncbi:hypothetical protein OA851_00565, partial [SAR86 cluster bacterium]|nr:hypothetical protein [SAR86 cluster bacterium]